MSNIKKFENIDELKKYLKSIALCKIGSGAEGDAYLTKDKQVLKVCTNQIIVHPYDENIITTDMIDLESFLFPTELLVYKNRIVAYKSRLFKNDIFYNSEMNDLALLDLNELLRARKKMIKDIEKLSRYNYKIIDLPYNLLFNGKNLAACDTLSYYKKENVLNDNLESLDYALNTKLKEIDPDYSYIIDEEHDTEAAIKKLMKEIEDTNLVVFPHKI